MRQTATEFEEARHRAEVAFMVRIFRTEGKDAVVARLKAIESGKRGKAARDRLEADALAALGIG